MSVMKRLRGDERGAALVLTALTMVVLVGMVAFVVDLGAQYNERRLSVTAADAATLAAAQNLGYGQTAAVTAAKEVARDNLRIKYTDAEWATLWATGAGCTNPAGYLASATTPCVAFNSGMTRVRVTIPEQVMKTAFGGVLGVKELRARAVAEAEIASPGPGGVLPFGILNAPSGDGQESCLKSTAGGHDGTAPCNGPDSGNFGSLDSPLYGSDQYNTMPGKCTGDENGRLQNNMVVGIDHQLDEYTHPALGSYESPVETGEPVRQNACRNDRPNTLLTQTGVGSNLDRGLVRDDAPYSGGPARLQRGPFNKTTVSTKQLDNKPLWEFIDPSLTAGAASSGSSNIPTTCVRSGFSGANANKTRLNQCFADYNLGGYTVPLFTVDDIDPGDGVYDIQLSPRFAFVPEFWETSFGTGSEWLSIKRFRAAYIQTLYFGCGGGCGIVFNPGETAGIPPGGGANNQTVDSMTAFIFRNSMLPTSVISTGPGGSLLGARTSLIR